MLTDRLKAVVDSMAQNAVELPPELQDKLAEQIATALENALWDAQLRDPEHLAVLRALADEAMKEPGLPLPTPEDMGDERSVQLPQRYLGQPPELEPELSSIVEQSVSELADTLEYLKDK